MDSLTQAALGAAIGEAILGKEIGRKASILGAIIGTIPDLDVLLLPFFSALERISIHRGLSHSILFSILGTFLIAFILSKLKWTAKISRLKLSLFTWLALFTHMLLDAFTAYGTQLFLPFSDRRVSFDSINIVDPVYTILLLSGLIITIYHGRFGRHSIANNFGIIVSSFYLLFTLGHKQHVTKSIMNELSEQNIDYQALKSIPVGVGNLEWYGVAKSRDSLFIGKYSDWQHNHIEFHSFPINAHLLETVDDDVVQKLIWFSQGFYTVAEHNGTIRLYNLQCDMQGVRSYGSYKVPTAFYYEILLQHDGNYELKSGMH